VTSHEGIIAGSLADGWAVFKANAGYLILITLGGLLGLFIFASVISRLIGFESALGLIGAGLVNGFFVTCIYGGMLKIILTMARRQEPVLSDLFAGFKYFFSMVAIEMVLYFFLWVSGLLIFIVASIFFKSFFAPLKDSQLMQLFSPSIAVFALWVLFICFIAFFWVFFLSPLLLQVMALRVGVVDALKHVRQQYKIGSYILFCVYAALICASGTIFFGLGLLVTCPFAVAAVVAFYNRVLVLNPPKY